MTTDLHAKRNATGLLSSVRGLHAMPTADLPFLAGVVVRSFLLERPEGNVIVYHSPGVTSAADDIVQLGQPDRLLVNHWHESIYDAPSLNVPIFVHERDRDQTELPVAGTFSSRQKFGSDIEIIPTPGHTAGTTVFVWDNGEHRFLFPGDSIWVQGGQWKAVLLQESDRDAYLESLALLMDVEFDYLVPWGAEEGQPYAYSVTPEEARANLGRIADRLRSGETT